MENLIINGKGISSTYNDGSWKIDANSGAVIIEDIIPHVGDAIAKGESIQVVFNKLFNNILPRIPIIDYANMFKTDENGIDSDVIDLISANIINERNPTCYGTDRRWANHLYPVYLTESYVKSKYISTEMFLHLF